ncbi:hypothetical protein Dred_0748 [Desulforamulus reducens MI-1]|uniref:Uncharacterized protein n=1 Tax=Desulforamulus reducens (strain ATCC BAA-1160 / DSM 100696 / MI-1) TaxID=349161 RepID=A4J2I4_DESRM|nr:hypothetical protein [Desulforamulus reducens]ABO49287.1 hypothetical protein Dred_0748 [Desulforamulus reducens MI-1]
MSREKRNLVKIFLTMLLAFSFTTGAHASILTPSSLIDYNSYDLGDTINFEANPAVFLKTIPNKFKNEQPESTRTLLFSDFPEYIDKPGISYQDTIYPFKNKGKFRIFDYHVNSSTEPLYFSVLLTNKNNHPVSVQIEKMAVAGPSMNYTAVGKTAVNEWLKSSVDKMIEIQPGKTVFLAEPVCLKKDQLVNFIYDATVSDAVQVTTVTRRDQKASLKGLPVLGKITEGGKTPTILRGTFDTADYYNFYVIGLDERGYNAVGVAGKSEYLQGYSAVDRKKVINYGNYGVLYHTKFQLIPFLQTPEAIVVNSRGGGFATAANITVNGELITQGLDTPSKTTAIGFNTVKQGILVFKNSIYNSDKIEIDWMPAGGTNLPVNFIVQPYQAVAPH